MSKSFQERLNNRRKKGPSTFEKQRGPNGNGWQAINAPIQRPSQSAFWATGYRTGGQNVKLDHPPRGY